MFWKFRISKRKYKLFYWLHRCYNTLYSSNLSKALEDFNLFKMLKFRFPSSRRLQTHHELNHHSPTPHHDLNSQPNPSNHHQTTQTTNQTTQTTQTTTPTPPPPPQNSNHPSSSNTTHLNSSASKITLTQHPSSILPSPSLSSSSSSSISQSQAPHQLPIISSSPITLPTHPSPHLELSHSIQPSPLQSSQLNPLHSSPSDPSLLLNPNHLNLSSSSHLPSSQDHRSSGPSLLSKTPHMPSSSAMAPKKTRRKSYGGLRWVSPLVPSLSLTHSHHLTLLLHHTSGLC